MGEGDPSRREVRDSHDEHAAQARVDLRVREKHQPLARVPGIEAKLGRVLRRARHHLTRRQDRELSWLDDDQALVCDSSDRIGAAQKGLVAKPEVLAGGLKAISLERGDAQAFCPDRLAAVHEHRHLLLYPNICSDEDVTPGVRGQADPLPAHGAVPADVACSKRGSRDPRVGPGPCRAPHLLTRREGAPGDRRTLRNGER